MSRLVIRMEAVEVTLIDIVYLLHIIFWDIVMKDS